jgi:Uma2 family endonuclease
MNLRFPRFYIACLAALTLGLLAGTRCGAQETASMIAGPSIAAEGSWQRQGQTAALAKRCDMQLTRGSDNSIRGRVSLAGSRLAREGNVQGVISGAVLGTITDAPIARGRRRRYSAGVNATVTFRSDERLNQREFARWLRTRPPSDVHHYELIQGRIVMSPPADPIHARLGALLGARLSAHVNREPLGLVLDASAGFDLPSGDTLEPDLSFVSAARLAAGPPLERGRFARVVPDLVVETLSRSTARRDRTEKKKIYARNGVREYWLVDPDERSITVFHGRNGEFDAGTRFTGGRFRSEVLPKLRFDVARLFAGQP